MQVNYLYMSNRKNGPILTSTRKEVLRREYEKGATRQAKQDHKESIKENTKLALEDFQFLFDHLDRDGLEDIVGGGPDVEGGPIAHEGNEMGLEDLDWGNATEFFTEYRDRDGKVWDPEQNPEAKTPYEWYREEIKESNKATPEMQKTLIDCVAFLCRAAEAGELNVQELIERGVERYYRGHPTKGSQLVDVRSWSEEKNGPKIEEYCRQTERESPSRRMRSVGGSYFDMQDAKSAMSRYMARENED